MKSSSPSDPNSQPVAIPVHLGFSRRMVCAADAGIVIDADRSAVSRKRHLLWARNGDPLYQIPYADVIWLKANRTSTDVQILYRSGHIDSSMTILTFATAFARDRFLSDLEHIFPGGMAREERHYGWFWNLVPPFLASAAAIALSVVALRDWWTRIDWQPLVISILLIFATFISLGWLTQRARSPAYMILLRPQSTSAPW